MQPRTILLHLFALPLRQKLVAGGIAVAIGSGLFAWSRYAATATPPATTAVLSFDPRGAGTGVMTANAKEPAVALAQSVLSDEAVRGLAKQAGLSFTNGKNDVVEFRSRLDLAQTSPRLLRVNYKGTDKKVSAAVANAVANTLVAYMPEPVVATATSTLARLDGPLATHASAKSLHRRHPSHSRSPALRELESQLAAADLKLAALDAQATASQKADAAAPPSSVENEHRRTLESQLSVTQKKLDDLRARYTDEYPDVETTKEDIAEIRQELASLRPVSNESERAADQAKLVADANEPDQLRLERAQLMQAIVVENQREAALRDQTASGVADSALAVQTVSPSLPRQAPVSQSLNPSAGQIWQRPFTLVRLAGGAGTSQSESGLLWYWPLAGVFCGLLYLAGAVWRYRTMESAAPLELNNKLRAEKASEYAGSFIHIDDRWNKEVLKSLSLTDIGREHELSAARHKPLAVDSRQQVDCCVPGLQEQAHDDHVLAAVRDTIERNPDRWMAHRKKARTALAMSDTDTAIKATRLATNVAPEEVKGTPR